MELLCSRSTAFSPTCRLHLRRNLKRCSFGITTAIFPSEGFSHFATVRSKLSDFQDYQGYAKPSRLIPATEVKVDKEISRDGKLNPSSQSLFKIKIQTSTAYDSGFSDINAGLLICIIDENGDSVLQRIPAVGKRASSSEPELNPNSILHFQRGSVDEFTFEGPRLGNIRALWISLESGQWRLGGLSISVVHAKEGADQDGDDIQFSGFKYDFSSEDVLLGEGSETSMVELRPSLVTSLSGSDPFTLLTTSMEDPTSPFTTQTSKEQSMMEYADLKLSLLLYDVVLILVGASVASVSSGENATLAFLTGGIAGFFYLLLLQISVDDLPAPASISRNTLDRVLGQLWTPVLTLAVAVSLVLVAMKYYGSGENAGAVTSKEVVLGMAGFLACKVAVVLSAFKPVSIRGR